MTKYYSGCFVNEVLFHTRGKDDCSITQNSCLVVEGGHTGKPIDFYGFVKSVVELTFFHAYKNDPFVLPNQVQQVFYIGDTKLGNHWRIAQQVQHRHLWNLPDLEKNDEEMMSGATSFVHEVLQQNKTSTVIIAVEDEELGFLNRQDSMKQKKGRGLTIGKLIENMIRANENKPLEIVFPEGCCKPVQYASQLASVVGYVVGRLSLLKDIRTYDGIPEEGKECPNGGLMVPPSPIDAWTVVHKRKDGNFVSDTAKAVDDKMKEERRRRIGSGEIIVDNKDIMGNILGKKDGYAKGLGYGVIPSKASRSSQYLVNTSLLEELRQYKEDLQNATNQLKSQEAKLQSYEGRIQTQDTQIQSLVHSNQEIVKCFKNFLFGNKSM
ncbi:hypothetical protein ACH5RR_026049 [Cinchona calisaya]|uniref:Uncharacterized protein n=1 Tax=Cinchona calisaya TaxID=153742 RepID=A0ABD2Z5E2_9GENT